MEIFHPTFLSLAASLCQDASLSGLVSFSLPSVYHMYIIADSWTFPNIPTSSLFPVWTPGDHNTLRTDVYLTSILSPHPGFFL